MSSSSVPPTLFQVGGTVYQAYLPRAPGTQASMWTAASAAEAEWMEPLRLGAEAFAEAQIYFPEGDDAHPPLYSLSQWLTGLLSPLCARLALDLPEVACPMVVLQLPYLKTGARSSDLPWLLQSVHATLDLRHLTRKSVLISTPSQVRTQAILEVLQTACGVRLLSSALDSLEITSPESDRGSHVIQCTLKGFIAERRPLKISLLILLSGSPPDLEAPLSIGLDLMTSAFCVRAGKSVTLSREDLLLEDITVAPSLEVFHCAPGMQAHAPTAQIVLTALHQKENALSIENMAHLMSRRLQHHLSLASPPQWQFDQPSEVTWRSSADDLFLTFDLSDHPLSAAYPQSLRLRSAPPEWAHQCILDAFISVCSGEDKRVLALEECCDAVILRYPEASVAGESPVQRLGMQERCTQGRRTLTIRLPILDTNRPSKRSHAHLQIVLCGDPEPSCIESFDPPAPQSRAWQALPASRLQPIIENAIQGASWGNPGEDFSRWEANATARMHYVMNMPLRTQHHRRTTTLASILTLFNQEFATYLGVPDEELEILLHGGSWEGVFSGAWGGKWPLQTKINPHGTAILDLDVMGNYTALLSARFDLSDPFVQRRLNTLILFIWIRALAVTLRLSPDLVRSSLLIEGPELLTSVRQTFPAALDGPIPGTNRSQWSAGRQHYTAICTALVDRQGRRVEIDVTLICGGNVPTNICIHDAIAGSLRGGRLFCHVPGELEVERCAAELLRGDATLSSPSAFGALARLLREFGRRRVTGLPSPDSPHGSPVISEAIRLFLLQVPEEKREGYLLRYTNARQSGAGILFFAQLVPSMWKKLLPTIGKDSALGTIVHGFAELAQHTSPEVSRWWSLLLGPFLHGLTSEDRTLSWQMMPLYHKNPPPPHWFDPLTKGHLNFLLGRIETLLAAGERSIPIHPHFYEAFQQESQRNSASHESLIRQSVLFLSRPLSRGDTPEQDDRADRDAAGPSLSAGDPLLDDVWLADAPILHELSHVHESDQHIHEPDQDEASGSSDPFYPSHSALTDESDILLAGSLKEAPHSQALCETTGIDFPSDQQSEGPAQEPVSPGESSGLSSRVMALPGEATSDSEPPSSAPVAAGSPEEVDATAEEVDATAYVHQDERTLTPEEELRSWIADARLAASNSKIGRVFVELYLQAPADLRPALQWLFQPILSKEHWCACPSHGQITALLHSQERRTILENTWMTLMKNQGSLTNFLLSQETIKLLETLALDPIHGWATQLDAGQDRDKTSWLVAHWICTHISRDPADHGDLPLDEWYEQAAHLALGRLLFPLRSEHPHRMSQGVLPLNAEWLWPATGPLAPLREMCARHAPFEKRISSRAFYSQKTLRTVLLERAARSFIEGALPSPLLPAWHRISARTPLLFKKKQPPQEEASSSSGEQEVASSSSGVIASRIPNGVPRGILGWLSSPLLSEEDRPPPPSAREVYHWCQECQKPTETIQQLETWLLSKTAPPLWEVEDTLLIVKSLLPQCTVKRDGRSARPLAWYVSLWLLRHCKFNREDAIWDYALPLHETSQKEFYETALHLLALWCGASPATGELRSPERLQQDACLWPSVGPLRKCRELIDQLFSPSPETENEPSTGAEQTRYGWAMVSGRVNMLHRIADGLCPPYALEQSWLCAWAQACNQALCYQTFLQQGTHLSAPLLELYLTHEQSFSALPLPIALTVLKALFAMPGVSRLKADCWEHTANKILTSSLGSQERNQDSIIALLELHLPQNSSLIQDLILAIPVRSEVTRSAMRSGKRSAEASSRKPSACESGHGSSSGSSKTFSPSAEQPARQLPQHLLDAIDAHMLESWTSTSELFLWTSMRLSTSMLAAVPDTANLQALLESFIRREDLSIRDLFSLAKRVADAPHTGVKMPTAALEMLVRVLHHDDFIQRHLSHAASAHSSAEDAQNVLCYAELASPGEEPFTDAQQLELLDTLLRLSPRYGWTGAFFLLYRTSPVPCDAAAGPLEATPSQVIHDPLTRRTEILQRLGDHPTSTFFALESLMAFYDKRPIHEEEWHLLVQILATSASVHEAITYANWLLYRALRAPPADLYLTPAFLHGLQQVWLHTKTSQPQLREAFPQQQESDGVPQTKSKEILANQLIRLALSLEDALHQQTKRPSLQYTELLYPQLSWLLDGSCHLSMPSLPSLCRFASEILKIHQRTPRDKNARRGKAPPDLSNSVHRLLRMWFKRFTSLVMTAPLQESVDSASNPDAPSETTNIVIMTKTRDVTALFGTTQIEEPWLNPSQEERQARGKDLAAQTTLSEALCFIQSAPGYSQQEKLFFKVLAFITAQGSSCPISPNDALFFEAWCRTWLVNGEKKDILSRIPHGFTAHVLAIARAAHHHHRAQQQDSPEALINQLQLLFASIKLYLYFTSTNNPSPMPNSASSSASAAAASVESWSQFCAEEFWPWIEMARALKDPNLAALALTLLPHIVQVAELRGARDEFLAQMSKSLPFFRGHPQLIRCILQKLLIEKSTFSSLIRQRSPQGEGQSASSEGGGQGARLRGQPSQKEREQQQTAHLLRNTRLLFSNLLEALSSASELTAADLHLFQMAYEILEPIYGSYMWEGLFPNKIFQERFFSRPLLRVEILPHEILSYHEILSRFIICYASSVIQHHTGLAAQDQDSISPEKVDAILKDVQIGLDWASAQDRSPPIQLATGDFSLAPCMTVPSAFFLSYAGITVMNRLHSLCPYQQWSPAAKELLLPWLYAEELHALRILHEPDCRFHDSPEESLNARLTQEHVIFSKTMCMPNGILPAILHHARFSDEANSDQPLLFLCTLSLFILPHSCRVASPPVLDIGVSTAASWMKARSDSQIQELIATLFKVDATFAGPLLLKLIAPFEGLPSVEGAERVLEQINRALCTEVEARNFDARCEALFSWGLSETAWQPHATILFTKTLCLLFLKTNSPMVADKIQALLQLYLPHLASLGAQASSQAELQIIFVFLFNLITLLSEPHQGCYLEQQIGLIYPAASSPPGESTAAFIQNQKDARSRSMVHLFLRERLQLLGASAPPSEEALAPQTEESRKLLVIVAIAQASIFRRAGIQCDLFLQLRLSMLYCLLGELSPQDSTGAPIEEEALHEPLRAIREITASLLNASKQSGSGFQRQLLVALAALFSKSATSPSKAYDLATEAVRLCPSTSACPSSEDLQRFFLKMQTLLARLLAAPALISKLRAILQTELTAHQQVQVGLEQLMRVASSHPGSPTQASSSGSQSWCAQM